MNVLITGAAGNLGSFLSRHLLNSPHHLKLMIHHKQLPSEFADHPNAAVYKADLGQVETLYPPCENTDCIVHFAGKLFAPQPERFLNETNVIYVKNLVAAAQAKGVGKFILISFPHVEGESSPQHLAGESLRGAPESVHARTRLEAERLLFAACEGADMVPVALRAGMIYAKGVLMIEAAHRLLERRLLGVWPEPTWIHLISLPDFLVCVAAAIDNPEVRGIYNLGDDSPLTLQEFLDRAAVHWGTPKPWRAPRWSFYLAAWCVETYARIFRTASPLTRDFIKIGMASYTADTSRMKAELMPHLFYPGLNEGIELL
jgi:nucleoside-diphosphate-sugar epimerase